MSRLLVVVIAQSLRASDFAVALLPLTTLALAGCFSRRTDLFAAFGERLPQSNQARHAAGAGRRHCGRLAKIELGAFRRI
jgi:hypothetical protein